MSMMPVDEARARLLDDAAPVDEVETLALRAIAGRVLAADVPALRTQPPFHASAMDGYAVRAEDATQGTLLAIIGESAAGAAFAGTVTAGTSVRIFTGAPVPAGADAVLIQENTTITTPGQLRVDQAVSAHRNIREAGSDFAEGSTVLSAGRRLTAGCLALAASAGYPALPVLRRPRVAILATGDELVLPGQTARPDQIIASNHFGLAALVEANGGTVLDLGIAPDDIAAIAGRLEQAEADRADIVVTIGGASVGDRDLVAPALEARGISLDFWKVAMRPGKPMMAGRKGGMRVLGLPGNPASTMVSATLFLRPWLRRMAGLPEDSGMRPGILAADVEAGDVRAQFMRARLQAGSGALPRIVPLPRQDSSLISIYAAADVLLFRPVHAPAALAGEPCAWIPLD